MGMGTKITTDIIESYLHCRYKGYLKKNGIEGEKTEYEIFQNELKEQHVSSYRKKLNETANTCYDLAKILTPKDFCKGYDYIFNVTIKSNNILLKIDALEKIQFKDRKTKFAYIPILFSANEKISKIEKGLISLVDKAQIGKPKYAKVIYGRNIQSSKINIESHSSSYKDIVKEVNLDIEPPLILNNHCPIKGYIVNEDVNQLK